MFGSLGLPELLVIFAIILVVFGAGKLPQLGRGLGEGRFLLQDRELEMKAGDLLIAPENVPHGVRNTGTSRLLVLAVLAPAPHR